MTAQVDLDQLAARESEQTEWKENVADFNNVAKTLSAFANDLANLGGGYVVCGAKEEKDEHGFPRLVRTGLTASRLKEVEGEVMSRCRSSVSPAITPLVQELPGPTADRRILVFVQAATSQAHTCRDDGAGKYYVRISRETREARNGVLRDLLVRKGAVPPWDRRPCGAATTADIDLLVLRDALVRMSVIGAEGRAESFLSADAQIHALVPPLCELEPLTGIARPRNFAMLLFGRNVQRFIPGAFSLFSVYPGTDRSETHAERHEIAGTVSEQARQLSDLLDAQLSTVFDKTNAKAPNVDRFPRRALIEAMGNTLAHRDYESADPVRITVFADRIEFLSPGPLPLGVEEAAFRAGKSSPKWRNQALAWFFNRLQLAQGEGQGIPTILRTMREAGCPPPTLEADATRVLCTLAANPRHAALASSISIGQEVKVDVVRLVLDRDARRDRLLQAITEAGDRGIRRADLGPLLPHASENEIKVLLRELRLDGKIHSRGSTKAARWYAGRAKGKR
jgi:ATP-dependent DNA helicase RecG